MSGLRFGRGVCRVRTAHPTDSGFSNQGSAKGCRSQIIAARKFREHPFSSRSRSPNAAVIYWCVRSIDCETHSTSNLASIRSASMHSLSCRIICMRFGHCLTATRTSRQDGGGSRAGSRASCQSAIYVEVIAFAGSAGSGSDASGNITSGGLPIIGVASSIVGSIR